MHRMHKQWIERTKEFFRADVLKECEERVNRENILSLCIVNLAMGMFSLMLCGHINSQQGAFRFLNTYALFFVISVVMYQLSKRYASKHPRIIPWMIVFNYAVWVVCVIGENHIVDSGTYLASYYALIILGGCFMIKPIYIVALQVASAALICSHMYFCTYHEYAVMDIQIVLILMSISIGVGFLVVGIRMRGFKRNGEQAQIVKVSTLYQSILDETQTGVYVREMGTYELLFINRKACEIFGVDASQAIGKKCYREFYHQQVACHECPTRLRNISPVINREVVIEGNTYAVKGKVIDWAGREAYVEYLTDITDAKKVSEQMRLAHESLEKKYEEEVLYREKAVSEDVISTSRINLTAGIVEEMRVGKTEGYEEKYRHTMVFSERIAAFCKGTWLLDEQNMRLSKDALLEQFSQGKKRVSEEYIAELKSGKHVWIRVEVSMVRRPETSEVVAFIYHRDITRERLLGHVLERIMSFEYDELYTVDSVNEKYELIAIGQYAVDEKQTAGDYQEKIELLIDRAVFGEDKEKIRQEMNLPYVCEVLRKEQTHLFEVTLIAKNGKPRRKRIRYMYLYEDVGTILVTVTDIDDVVQAEKAKQEQLEEALHLAREASRAKSSFLASMSHEIRTPMNAIIGLNSIIKDNIEDAEQVLDCSDKLDSASRYLLALLNDILDMSRIESGNMTLAHEAFDADRFWENINILVKAQADLASVRYIFERRCRTTGRYLGDATRLQQIMINLVNNAIKFTSEGGFVRVRVLEETDEMGRAVINATVEDNGIGISEEFLPEVFGTFTQQHAGSTTSYKGSGLGLSIARNFAQMMDGDITVASKEGLGTKFTVHVLLDINSQQTDVNTLEDKSAERMFDGKKILLVEDHPLNIMVAKNLLTKRGFEVVHAENGLEALHCFEDSGVYEFDAILMDIRMPVMDGIESARKIRALEREDAMLVPIIAMTANAYEEDHKQTAEAGMNAHLAKPIDPNQLFRTLDTYIT